MAPGAGVEEFAADFQEVYGEELTSALESMRAKGIQGRKVDTTCDGEPVIWPGDALQVNLAGSGDGWFYGGLDANLVTTAHEDRPAIYAKFFVVDGRVRSGRAKSSGVPEG